MKKSRRICFGHWCCAALLERIGTWILDSSLSQDNPYDIFVLAFLVVAAVEEGTKMCFLKLRTWNDWNFSHLFDGVVYSAFVSLGFAAFENIKAEICAFANEKKRALFLPDQDILTALYGDHVKLLDSLRYNLSDRGLALHNAESQKEKLGIEWVRKNSVIVHYCGKSKPWKEHYHGPLGVFYQELAEQRNSELAGSPIDRSDA